MINAHPRIGERPDKVSALSFKEQGYDRDLTPPEVFLRLAGIRGFHRQHDAHAAAVQLVERGAEGAAGLADRGEARH